MHNRLLKYYKKEINKKHKGFGGMVFLSVTMLALVIMFLTLRLSAASTSEGMANQMAFFEAQRVANQLYLGGSSSNSGTTKYGTPITDGQNPVDVSAEWNSILMPTDANNFKIAKSVDSNTYTYSWNSNTKSLSLQLPSFKNFMGDTIKPKEQHVIVEPGS